MEHPLISGPYINQQISGDPGTNWLAWVKRDFVPNVLDRGLSLGCGSGGLERHAIKLGICKRFDAFDISREAIEMAIQYAAMEGINSIHYELKDINEIELPESQYDIVLISSALHHSKELEHVLTQVDKSLKLGGLFAFSEFVGPSQFQWTDKQLRIINDLLALLPRKYKIDIRTLSRFNITTAVSAGAGLRPSLLGLTKGLKAGWRLAVSRTLRSKNLAEPKRGFIIKKQVGRPTIEQMNIGDPSEAIRSAEIVPLVGKYFKIIQRVDFGGTLLHMLLSDIVGNFDPDREEDTAIIKLLCYLERTLIKEGVLPSDFTVIVARSRIP
jgi:SAM-dependent methyltransferase